MKNTKKPTFPHGKEKLCFCVLMGREGGGEEGGGTFCSRSNLILTHPAEKLKGAQISSPVKTSSARRNLQGFSTRQPPQEPRKRKKGCGFQKHLLPSLNPPKRRLFP